MKCGDPSIVFDFRDTLASGKENEITLKSIGDILFLNILSKTDETNKKVLQSSFEHTVYYSFQSMPGVKMSNIKHGYTTENFTKLIKFGFSEIVTQWENHFNGIFKFKHFCVFFEDENKYLEVVSKDFKVVNSEE